MDLESWWERIRLERLAGSFRFIISIALQIVIPRCAGSQLHYYQLIYCDANSFYLTKMDVGSQADFPCRHSRHEPIYPPAAKIFPIAPIRFNYLSPSLLPPPPTIQNFSTSLVQCFDHSEMSPIPNSPEYSSIRKQQSFMSDRDELRDEVPLIKISPRELAISPGLEQGKEMKISDGSKNNDDAVSVNPSLAIQEENRSLRYQLRDSSRNDNQEVRNSLRSNFYDNPQITHKLQRTSQSYMNEGSEPIKRVGKKNSDFCFGNKRRTQESIEKQDDVIERQSSHSEKTQINELRSASIVTDSVESARKLQNSRAKEESISRIAIKESIVSPDENQLISGANPISEELRESKDNLERQTSLRRSIWSVGSERDVEEEPKLAESSMLKESRLSEIQLVSNDKSSIDKSKSAFKSQFSRKPQHLEALAEEESIPVYVAPETQTIEIASPAKLESCATRPKRFPIFPKIEQVQHTFGLKPSKLKAKRSDLEGIQWASH